MLDRADVALLWCCEPAVSLTGGSRALRFVGEVWVINARHMRNVPGRKTDVGDAQWGAQLLEHGLVRPSFVPPPAIRELRDLSRYQKSVIEERGRESQRLHKVLEDAGVKLTSFTSKVLTKSGREMIEALIAGQRDPVVLADLAKARMRRNIGQFGRRCRAGSLRITG